MMVKMMVNTAKKYWHNILSLCALGIFCFASVVAADNDKYIQQGLVTDPEIRITTPSYEVPVGETVGIYYTFKDVYDCRSPQKNVTGWGSDANPGVWRDTDIRSWSTPGHYSIEVECKTFRKDVESIRKVATVVVRKDHHEKSAVDSKIKITVPQQEIGVGQAALISYELRRDYNCHSAQMRLAQVHHGENSETWYWAATAVKRWDTPGEHKIEIVCKSYSNPTEIISHAEVVTVVEDTFKSNVRPTLSLIQL